MSFHVYMKKDTKENQNKATRCLCEMFLKHSDIRKLKMQREWKNILIPIWCSVWKISLHIMCCASQFLPVGHTPEPPKLWELWLSSHLHQTVLWACPWEHFLDEWWMSTQVIVGSATLGRWLLEVWRKLAEHSMKNKPASRVHPGCLLQFLSWVPALVPLYGRLSPFLPRLFLVSVLSQQRKLN